MSVIYPISEMSIEQVVGSALSTYGRAHFAVAYLLTTYLLNGAEILTSFGLRYASPHGGAPEPTAHPHLGGSAHLAHR